MCYLDSERQQKAIDFKGLGAKDNKATHVAFGSAR
jgi:hypothetical protein